jgi:hypothetical protein
MNIVSFVVVQKDQKRAEYGNKRYKNGNDYHSWQQSYNFTKSIIKNIKAVFYPVINCIFLLSITGMIVRVGRIVNHLIQIGCVFQQVQVL